MLNSLLSLRFRFLLLVPLLLGNGSAWARENRIFSEQALSIAGTHYTKPQILPTVSIEEYRRETQRLNPPSVTPWAASSPWKAAYHPLTALDVRMCMTRVFWLRAPKMEGLSPHRLLYDLYNPDVDADLRLLLVETTVPSQTDPVYTLLTLTLPNLRPVCIASLTLRDGIMSDLSPHELMPDHKYWGRTLRLFKRSEPASASAAEGTFTDAESLGQWLKGVYPPLSYPTPFRGYHFTTYAHPRLNLYEKDLRPAEMSSVLLARERLGGLTAGFFFKLGKDPRLYMEALPNLDTEIFRLVFTGRWLKARSLLRQFMEANINILKRGVFVYDARLENFALQGDKVVLIDIGGLIPCELALDQTGYISDLLMRLHHRMPFWADFLCIDLIESFQFSTLEEARRSIQTHMYTDAPQRVEWAYRPPRDTPLAPNSMLEKLRLLRTAG